MNPFRARQLNRNAFRRAVRMPCQIVRERDFRLVADLAVDLSTEGMLALTNVPVLTGEPVIVAFRSLRQNRWFDAEATVARVVHGRRPGDLGHSVGLAFHGTDNLFKDSLFQHLRRLPPPRPARAWPVMDAPDMTPVFELKNGKLIVAVSN